MCECKHLPKKMEPSDWFYGSDIASLLHPYTQKFLKTHAPTWYRAMSRYVELPSLLTPHKIGNKIIDIESPDRHIIGEVFGWDGKYYDECDECGKFYHTLIQWMCESEPEFQKTLGYFIMHYNEVHK